MVSVSRFYQNWTVDLRMQLNFEALPDKALLEGRRFRDGLEHLAGHIGKDAAGIGHL